jgi:YfiH family protein
VFTTRADGDFADGAAHAGVPPAGVPTPWTQLHQVHGSTVVVVREPGERRGVDADAAVTAAAGCALAVRIAECAPVALLADEAVGMVHVGWRGLLGGVLERAVEQVRVLGAGPSLRAVVGPCIRAGCYEFRGDERDALADRYGSDVLAETVWGTPALDVVAGVRAGLAAAGVFDVEIASGCTACDRTWFSHRARNESSRQAGFVWLETDPRAAGNTVRE